MTISNYGWFRALRKNCYCDIVAIAAEAGIKRQGIRMECK
jgi:hypothetical protein